MFDIYKTLKCYACGHEGSSDDFTTYRGDLGDNVGICRSCSDKGIVVMTKHQELNTVPPKVSLEDFTKAIDEFNEFLMKFITSTNKHDARSISSKMTKRLMLIYRYVYENCKDDEGEEK